METMLPAGNTTTLVDILTGNYGNTTNETMSFVTQDYTLSSRLRGIAGTISIIVNFFLLVYIIRVLKQQVNSFTVQILFVCVNDFGLGLSLFGMGMLSVDSYTSAVACVMSMMFVVAFQSISSGNVLCICIQRYIFARHIKQTVPRWRTIHTVSMIGVNTVIAVFNAVTYTMSFKLLDPPYPSTVCSSATVINETAVNLSGMPFFFGILFILSADVLCLLTIYTLKKSIPVRPSNTAPSATSDQARATASSAIAKSRSSHNNAIMTILMLLVSYNATTTPVLVAAVLRDVYLSREDLRLVHVLSILPTLAHPAIMISRTHTLRDILKSDIRKVITILRP